MDAIPFLTRGPRLWKDKADFFHPFRVAAKDNETINAVEPLYDPTLATGRPDEDGDLIELNENLQTLVKIFPDVDAEVFRDVLSSLSPESRVAVVAEHVLKRNLKNTSTKRSRRAGYGKERDTRPNPTITLPEEQKFRGQQYHDAVKVLFYQEFRSLSHSTIKGVMAEHNGSYTRSRPVLQYLSSRTWRASLASLWKGNTSDALVGHPAIIWRARKGHAAQFPSVKSTGSAQLDRELYDLLVKPVVDKLIREQLLSDRALAITLNDTEATQHSATYDCECCYAAVAFEQIATCEPGDHYLCFDCIKRTTAEAVYGQGWARSVDLEKSTIRCFAPALQGCLASLSAETVRRALQQDLSTPELWSEFCRRISSEVLLKSRLVLQRCPKCDYAEADETSRAALRTSAQFQAHLARALRPHVLSGFDLLLARVTAPFLLMLLSIAFVLTCVLAHMTGLAALLRSTSRPPVTIKPFTIVGPLATPLSVSLGRIDKARRGLKFKCQHPECLHISCVRCLADWQDPHSCFDNERTSLRTAIEASATAAIKRTCPRCLLSFVKASGCNKLVCNCGYTMCYVCRSEITSKEGYAHFCQHFRPMGGNCTECDRCDLYGDEDEEMIIKRAGAMAEQEWKKREAAKILSLAANGADLGAAAMVDAIMGHGTKLSWHERCLDTLMDAVVVFDDT